MPVHCGEVTSSLLRNATDHLPAHCAGVIQLLLKAETWLCGRSLCISYHIQGHFLNQPISPTFGMVSVSPHPRGQVVSGLNPLKSFLTPLTVLALSLKSKFLLSLLNIGLIRYSWSWNFLYVRPDIFECVSLILNKYWKALLLTFNVTIF